MTLLCIARREPVLGEPCLKGFQSVEAWTPLGRGVIVSKTCVCRRVVLSMRMKCVAAKLSTGGRGVNYDSQIIHDELEVTELHHIFLLCPCVA